MTDKIYLTAENAKKKIQKLRVLRALCGRNLKFVSERKLNTMNENQPPGVLVHDHDGARILPEDYLRRKIIEFAK